MIFHFVFTHSLFSWFHNKTHRLLDQNDRPEILIVNAQEHHAGIYTCLAMNLFGNTSADIHLNVTSSFERKMCYSEYFLLYLVIPRFTFEAQRFLNGIISKSLLLPCNHIGLPKPTVKWFKDDQVEEKHNERLLYVLLRCLGISCRRESNDDRLDRFIEYRFVGHQRSWLIYL